MKQLLTILCLVLLVSCSKNTTQEGIDEWYRDDGQFVRMVKNKNYDYEDHMSGGDYYLELYEVFDKDGELLVRKDFKNREEYRKENYFEGYHDGHVLMIKGYYKTVLLITHLDSLKDIADMTIDIERQNGYAYVNQ